MLQKIGILLLCLITTSSFAKNLNLYEQPKSDAKIVGTLDPSKGIVPIFTPKGGDWVKIGNPNNGDIGWVKSSDLAQSSTTPSGFSFSQQIESTGSGPKSYVFKLGVPAPLTKEQADALYKQIQAQQAAIQQSVQKVIQDVFTNYNQSGTLEIPIVMPVVLMPPNSSTIKPNQPAQATAPATNQKK